MQRSLNIARAGFTLIEVVIAATIVSLLLLGLGITTLSGDRVYKAGMAQDRSLVLARRALDRIADAISMGGVGALTPNPVAPLGSSTLSFRTPSGYAGGAVTWNSSTRIDFQYTPRDPNDGLDNDRDGFIDDGMIVLTRDVGLATEQSTVLARGVSEYLEGEIPNGADDNGNGLRDERGLSFDISGDQLTIRITVVSRDGNGRNVVRTVSTSVKVRN
jgi:prepilin-type N-terminal cleavage/methylation domain-containing protein